MIDHAGGSGNALRAFLKIGSGTLAHQQAAFALACECTKIICISRGLTPELVELQHEIERAGARFHCITGPRGLAGLVTAIDDVIVINDGLLAPQQEMQQQLERGQCIIVQPAESGIAAGFERVDATHAAAGLMRIPGRLLEQLSQLPADCDAASALTRIALQAGISKYELTADTGLLSGFKIIRNQSDADTIEAEWFDQQLRNKASLEHGIGWWFAQQVLKVIGRSVLHTDQGGNLFAFASLAAMILALVAGWLGFSALSLICCAVAALAGLTFGMMRKIEQQSIVLWQRGNTMGDALPWLLDGILIAILARNMSATTLEADWHSAFAPFMLLVILRLIARFMDAGLAEWFADRVFLCGVLAVLAVAGWLSQAVVAIAVCAGLIGLFWPIGRMRITPD
jgi:hypothetical protein